jgi:hypothetical protein
MPSSDYQPTLAELFVRHGVPMELNGQTVRLAADIPLASRHTVGRLLFRKARRSPVQGACMKVSGGSMTVAGQSAKSVVLWADSAPPEVDFEIAHRSSKEVQLRVWNCWRHGSYGSPQYFQDNAGLIVETPAPDTYVLRCSDGWDEPTFDDVVLELSVRPA